MKALQITIFSGVRAQRWRGIKPTLTAVCTYGKRKGLLYTNEYILSILHKHLASNMFSFSEDY